MSFATLVVVIALGMSMEVKAQNPVCLLNQCGGPLGVFTLYCNSACQLAGYTSGTCTSGNGDNPDWAQCDCNGNGSPELLTVPTACAALCGPSCQSCGYDVLTAYCTITGKTGLIRCDCPH